MTTTRTAFWLACLALGGPPARGEEPRHEAAPGEPTAAEVMGGQGRGSGSGKPSSDHELGADEPATKGSAARRPDDPRDADRQAQRTDSREPSDPKMSRIGGTPGETAAESDRSGPGSPSGSQPQHDQAGATAR